MDVFSQAMLAVAVVGLAACLASIAVVLSEWVKTGFQRRFIWYIYELALVIAYAWYVCTWPVELAPEAPSRVYYVSPLTMFLLAIAPVVIERVRIPRLQRGAALSTRKPQSLTRWWWVWLVLETLVLGYFLDWCLRLGLLA